MLKSFGELHSWEDWSSLVPRDQGPAHESSRPMLLPMLLLSVALAFASQQHSGNLERSSMEKVGITLSSVWIGEHWEGLESESLSGDSRVWRGG